MSDSLHSSHSSPENHEEQQGVDVRARLALLQKTLEDAQKETTRALRLINELTTGSQALPSAFIPAVRSNVNALPHDDLSDLLLKVDSSLSQTPASMEPRLVLEGVFDGKAMIGNDGKEYAVPANYASKSKLVEGDLLKLTISSNGSFIYKPIAPVPRVRIVGRLEQEPDTRDYFLTNEEGRWHILTASVTFYHGVIGDEVVALIAQDRPCRWAAVEHIMSSR